MLPRCVFADSVRRALADLYEPGSLQSNPLTALVTDTSGLMRAVALRQLLIDTIESLKPNGPVPFGAPEWLHYRVLYHRYVEFMSYDEVSDEIGFSRASYYRYHREALDAVTSVLWQRYVKLVPADETGESHATRTAQESLSPTQVAVAEAVRVSFHSPQEEVHIVKLLDEVSLIAAPIARQQGVTLRVEYGGGARVVVGNATMLRLVLLDLLSESISLRAEDEIQLVVHVDEQAAFGTLTGVETTVWQQYRAGQLDGFAVSRGLLSAYHGEFLVDQDQAGHTMLGFCVRMSSRRRILIVEDDAEAVALYRRYLAPYEYTIDVAASFRGVQACLDASRPDIVLLDVLLPGDDGRQILQRLRLNPKMNGVPILVCSVLVQPGVALALGATRVLQKPVSPVELVRALEELLPGCCASNTA